MTGRDSDDSELTPAWRPLCEETRPRCFLEKGDSGPRVGFVAIPRKPAPPEPPISLPRSPKRSTGKRSMR